MSIYQTPPPQGITGLIALGRAHRRQPFGRLTRSGNRARFRLRLHQHEPEAVGNNSGGNLVVALTGKKEALRKAGPHELPAKPVEDGFVHGVRLDTIWKHNGFDVHVLRKQLRCGGDRRPTRFIPVEDQ